MTIIDELSHTLGEHGWRLRKASPKPDRLTLEVAAEDGEVSAAQWYVDPAHAAEAARLLFARFGHDTVALLDDRLLLQRAGADRKLPVVQRIVARPGSVLVAHRAERRAVVRIDDGRYVKVVRPERVEELLGPLGSLRLPGVRTPQVLEVDERRGCVTTDALPGRTVHTRLLDPAVPDDDAARDAHLTGTALRALHSQDADLNRPTHTGEAELAAARRWLDGAVQYGLLSAEACTRAYDAVAPAVLARAEPLTSVHRDFHDKQVLVDGESVGILDLDLACAGEPSVDVANLFAHLHLRQSQGVARADRVSPAASAFLTGYGEPAVRPDRFEAYVASTRLRLAGVYAFRPSRAGLCDELLEAAASPVAGVR